MHVAMSTQITGWHLQLLSNTMRNKTIFIVEDSKATAEIYKSYLDDVGGNIRIFHQGLDALEAISEIQPDILLLDIELPDINGLEILEFISINKLPVTTIVLTSHGSAENVERAEELGSFDFIEKPCSKQRLRVTIKNSISHGELVETVKTYSNNFDKNKFNGFIGRSLEMQLVYRIIESAAKCYASVFITGESGTGKELCAQAIHDTSNKKDKPFVALNCAAIPRDLFESEIFGHVKGAFSGALKDRIGAVERAEGGTLFLDEICEMDIDLQSKLLRFLQSGTFNRVGDKDERKVHTRIICATNRNPEEEVMKKRFREDLYYRLNVLPVEMPPLRERKGDMLILAKYFLEKFSMDLGKNFVGLTEETEKIFSEYYWPGNIRELQNTLENAVILHNGDLLEKSMLPKAMFDRFSLQSEIVSSHVSVEDEIAHSTAAADTQTIQPFWLSEKKIIQAAVDFCEGNVQLAARKLELSPSTIYRKMKSWCSDT